MTYNPDGYFEVFFFQAEDAMRDSPESRGLGDVYRGQLQSSQAATIVNTNIAVARSHGPTGLSPIHI